MTGKSTASTTAEPLRRRWPFAVVLAASLLLAVAQPLMSGLFDERGTFDVFLSLLIVTVLVLVFEQKEHRRVAFSLGWAALASIWASHGFDSHASRLLLVGAHLLGACFFVFALYGILRAILVKQASGDAIFGALVGYLLLGTIWSILYSAVEMAFPGSFCMPAPASTTAAVAAPGRGDLSYFSFITLATVGYGDVTPTTPLARTLAWIEAIAGQFYLAVLVAGLVGFKVTQAMKE